MQVDNSLDNLKEQWEKKVTGQITESLREYYDEDSPDGMFSSYPPDNCSVLKLWRKKEEEGVEYVTLKVKVPEDNLQDPHMILHSDDTRFTLDLIEWNHLFKTMVDLVAADRFEGVVIELNTSTYFCWVNLKFDEIIANEEKLGDAHRLLSNFLLDPKAFGTLIWPQEHEDDFKEKFNNGVRALAETVSSQQSNVSARIFVHETSEGVAVFSMEVPSGTATISFSLNIDKCQPEKTSPKLGIWLQVSTPNAGSDLLTVWPDIVSSISVLAGQNGYSNSVFEPHSHFPET
jgi:hypothetical protein